MTAHDSGWKWWLTDRAIARLRPHEREYTVWDSLVVVGGGGSGIVHPFVQRRAPVQVSGAIFEEGLDRGGLDLDAGIAGICRSTCLGSSG